MIPFRYGSVVTGKFFYGRDNEIKLLTEYIKSSQNCVLYGERRIGKTSLVYETINRLGSKYLPINIDLMGVKSLDDICRRMINRILVTKWNASAFQQILSFLSSLRPQISIDPITNLPTVSLDISQRLNNETLEYIFRIVDELSKKKNIIIFFDEFQDILNLKDSKQIVAILRGKIQLQTNVPYIYAGSVMKSMINIFTGSDSPFFKSAIPMDIQPIPKEETKIFVSKTFKADGRILPEQLFDKIYNLSGGITGDIQQLCEALWNVTDRKSSLKSLDLVNAVNLILGREKNSYEQAISNITSFQFNVLLALAKHGGKEIYGNDFMMKSGFTNASSVRSGITKLLDLKLICHYKNEYKFINPFFALWLKINRC